MRDIISRRRLINPFHQAKKKKKLFTAIKICSIVVSPHERRINLINGIRQSQNGQRLGITGQ